MMNTEWFQVNLSRRWWPRTVFFGAKARVDGFWHVRKGSGWRSGCRDGVGEVDIRDSR